MKLVDPKIENYVEIVKELVEDGETLLFERADDKRYIVIREGTNNKYATMQNCADGEIDSFHIFSEIEELLSDTICYTNISLTISVK